MYHVWLRNHIVLERNGRREVTELYVRGAGGRLLRSHNHLWFLYNNRGDVVQRVDNTGQVLHTYRFSAFGVEINPDPSNSNPWRFNGEYHDMHRGGEIYLRARVYNARLGRFSQPDAFWGVHNIMRCRLAILQSGNLYMYALHNPVMWIDPNGLEIVLGGAWSSLDCSIAANNTMLAYLQQLTDHVLGLDAHNRVVIHEFATGNFRHPHGNTLIERLIASSHTVTIFYSRGRNEMNPLDRRYASRGGMTGSNIWFNPHRESLYYLINPTTGFVVPEYHRAGVNALAHELIHADRAMRGQFINYNRFASFTFQTGVERRYVFLRSWFWYENVTVTRRIQREELGAIGLDSRFFGPDDITENMIRQELGLPLRGAR